MYYVQTIIKFNYTIIACGSPKKQAYKSLKQKYNL